MTREGKTSQSAAIVIFSSTLVNPVFGWSLTMLLDNIGIIGDKERGQKMTRTDRWIIPTGRIYLTLHSNGCYRHVPWHSSTIGIFPHAAVSL